MRDCLAMLRKSEAPEIINIASAAAHYGTKGQSIYGASKFAVLWLSETFALEVWEEGVHVHVLSPDGVLTDIIKEARPDLGGAPMIAPDDVADAMEYLFYPRTGATVDEICIRRTSRSPTF
jgi:short-subunit dehydrogenase